MLTGNKGEWSEIYALFKLLGDKKIFSGDADLNKIEDLFYPIVRIIRSEVSGSFEYEISGDLVIISGNEEKIRIPVRVFAEQALNLLKKIKEAVGVFSVSETEIFMNKIYYQSIKAKSTIKSDIRIVIHDPKINQVAEVGFSIKSQLGGDSTLLNAGKTTNFIYKIEGFNNKSINLAEVNNIQGKRKIRERVEAVINRGGFLRFIGLENKIFQENLVLVDSLLPDILGEMVKIYYSSDLNKIKELCKILKKENPLKYESIHNHLFYDYKIKKFLTDVALGMRPADVWNGVYDATGGYLIVKENGDVLCYHIYNRNHFEDYLFANTKLETASSTRHQFGELYEKNGSYYLKLNLQIRFI